MNSNATYSPEEIASITGGELLLRSASSHFSRLLLDSRKISQPQQSLFCAIKGDRHDGHAYLKELYDAGVRNFVVEDLTNVTELKLANIIRVKNSVSALQMLAAHHRARFDIPVIGITGSNGKTIVKEWLNTLLADDFNIVRSPKSFNSQIGVPLSVWNMEASHTLGIFEAGISKPGEMEKLARVIQPTIGVFTSIGTAHSENFLSRRQLVGEKLTLFGQAQTIICPEDSEAMQLISQWGANKKLIFTPNADKVLVSSRSGNSTVRVNDFDFIISFSDRASVENALTCICCLLSLDYQPEEIQRRLHRLAPLEMRLQLLDGEDDSIVVNDAYSNDLQSLEIALDFLNQHARGRKKVAVISDILQSGLAEVELHARIQSLLKSKRVDKVIGIGKSISANAAQYEPTSEFFASTDDFLSSKNAAEFSRCAVLVKGARDFRFERIVSFLQEKSHDTVLEVDMNALAHNLNYYRSKLLPATRVMVMVKAFGYGSGAHEVASLLEFNKVDYLAVAYTDEGVQLRKAGVSLPIMVMNAEHSNLATMIRHKLEPEIFSFRSLRAFVHACETAGIVQPYPIHIKLDTGMHRLGFEAVEIEKLANQLAGIRQIKVASVFTHLAATDERKHDAFTNMQFEMFDQSCKQLKELLGHDFLKHALNTSGISRFPNSQYDMVRLGIGLYGIAVNKEDAGKLQTVGKLKTIISQIKNISAGESIGYSRKFVAQNEMRIATIPVGYADGIRRALSNGVGQVWAGGQRCPVVGNVCMDMMMVDISGVNCAEGDEVIVFGNEITLEEIAKKCGTIPYEILTSISQRVKRLYVEG